MYHPKSSRANSKVHPHPCWHQVPKSRSLQAIRIPKADVPQECKSIFEILQLFVLPSQELDLIRLWQIAKACSIAENALSKRKQSVDLYLDDKDAWRTWKLFELAWLHICEAWWFSESWKQAKDGRSIQPQQKNLLLHLINSLWWYWNQPDRSWLCCLLWYRLEPSNGQTGTRSLPQNRSN